MALVGRPRWTLAVPTDGSAELVPLRLLLPFGKPGGFQVQVPLQSPTGGGANGAGVVEPGQLGAFGRDEIAAQLPLGHGCSRGIGIGIHAGTGGPDAGLQAGADPVDYLIRGGPVVSQLVQAGQAR